MPCKRDDEECDARDDAMKNYSREKYIYPTNKNVAFDQYDPFDNYYLLTDHFHLRSSIL